MIFSKVLSTAFVAAAAWIGVVGCAYAVHQRASGRKRIGVLSLNTLHPIESVFALTVGPSRDRLETASGYAMARADPRPVCEVV